MRLCDRDIEAWLDELAVCRSTHVRQWSVINGATVGCAPGQ